MTQTEQKLAELKALRPAFENASIEKKPMSEEETIQLREVFTGIKKYKGNPKALKKYLTHTRNELRSTN